MPHFPSEFLSLFPKTPNKRRGDMTMAAWLWEGKWTQDQRDKALEALRLYAVYVSGLRPEEKKFEPCPCKWMQALELMDFEPDESWIPEIRCESRNEVVCGDLVTVKKFYRIIDGRREGPFASREEAEGRTTLRRIA